MPRPFLQAAHILLRDQDQLGLPRDYVRILELLCDSPGFSPATFEEVLADFLASSSGDIRVGRLRLVATYLRSRALVVASR